MLHTEAPRPQANATVGGKVEVSPPFALKFEAKADPTRCMLSLGVAQNEGRNMYGVPPISDFLPRFPGPYMDLTFRKHRVAYGGDERTEAPYPGLEQFKLDRKTRDRHYGEGSSTDDPEHHCAGDDNPWQPI